MPFALSGPRPHQPSNCSPLDAMVISKLEIDESGTSCFRKLDARSKNRDVTRRSNWNIKYQHTTRLQLQPFIASICRQSSTPSILIADSNSPSTNLFSVNSMLKAAAVINQWLHAIIETLSMTLVLWMQQSENFGGVANCICIRKSRVLRPIDSDRAVEVNSH